MLDQITSTLGVLVDVDWQHNFQSFYETVRIKISCKDPSKIPEERLFGIKVKIYRLLIEVEPIPNTAEVDADTGPAAANQTSMGSETRGITPLMADPFQDWL